MVLLAAPAHGVPPATSHVTAKVLARQRAWTLWSLGVVTTVSAPTSAPPVGSLNQPSKA